MSFAPEDVEMVYASASPPAASAVKPRRKPRASPTSASPVSDVPIIASPNGFGAWPVSASAGAASSFARIEQLARGDDDALPGPAVRALLAEAQARGGNKDQASTLLRTQPHLEAAQESPLMPALRAMLAKLPHIQYRTDERGCIEAGEAAYLLRHDRARLSLPLYGFKHETELLRQSGRVQWLEDGHIRTRDFPPCMRGEACVASVHWRSIEHLPGPIVLMRAMSPAQWRELRLNAVAPAGQAPCVLCHRHEVSELVYFVRSVAVGPAPMLHVENAPPLVQLWRNPVACADGYCANYTLHPVEGGAGGSECILAPVCQVYGRMLAAERAPTHECVHWRINQAKLAWTPPVVTTATAQIGESVSSFSRGAGDNATPRSTCSVLNTNRV